ncbi:hypothetical protein cyc_00956 [Cyclospora cayetanensis]|uniref:Uncharacterized protein n=1 Tax=Cyclospora cayetanensis TaxID=88456 RepID=A0A1D3D940_9EIME|nr:hypothetical protein cyc_00956 [Cyclospora cayetanensis]
MGASASSATRTDGRPSTRPEEEWMLENVLFFDPQQQAAARGALATHSGPTVKRFTPSRAKLRNRNFRVFFNIERRRQEFLLKLVNDPTCRILLCDRAGRELKEILTSRIKYMQRQDVTAEVYVRTETGDVASLAFEFENIRECELFEEFVHFFGAKKILNAKPYSSDISDAGSESENEQSRHLAARANQRAQALQARTGCPLHGNQACLCAVERPALDFLKNSKYDSDSEAGLEEEKEMNARHAARFPVAIDGACEVGRDVRLKDLAARANGRMAARVVEWFVATKQGKDPTFPTVSESVGQAFRLEHRHVGRYIQVRASRRLEVTDRSPFVYSLAIKGPVTVDDQTARAMLVMLGKCILLYVVNIGHSLFANFPDVQLEVSFNVTTKGQDLQRLFGLSPAAVNASQPFFDLTMNVTREALCLFASLPSFEAPLMLQMAYNAFYVTLVPEEELDEREENLRLRIHFPSYSRRKNLFELVMAESFDRWARDLEIGDFSFLKNRYSRLWAETPWVVFSSIEGTGEQLVPERDMYAQQLLAEYRQAGAAEERNYM